jgi:hypothetical protein
MTSLLLESFAMPRSARDANAFGTAEERAGDVLAGRTVWCAAGRAADHAPARELRTRLEGAGPGVHAAWLQMRNTAEASGLVIDEPIRPGDVVIAHDALSATAAAAARERGAHAVWRVRITQGPPDLHREVVALLARLAPAIDAYLLSWVERTAHGGLVERVAAVMPWAGIVAAKEFPTRFGGNEPRQLAWRMAVAEVVRGDRDEAVGGTLHPKPTVAAR